MGFGSRNLIHYCKYVFAKSVLTPPPPPPPPVVPVSIGLDNGLSPIRRQAINYPNAGLLSIAPLGTIVSE